MYSKIHLDQSLMLQQVKIIKDLGLNEITSAQSPFLEILVSNSRTTEQGIYFQAQSGAQSKWQNFKVNFMATNRQDIELGSAAVYNPATTPVTSL